MTAESDERELLARAQRGDLVAFGAVVRRYEQLAFRAAYLVTRDKDEAADAAQEAFVSAYRALDSFRMDAPFRPWLLRIVTNKALNRLKGTRRRTARTELVTREMMAAAESPSPQSMVERKEQRQQLLQAVDRLEPSERHLISLRYFLELPEAEVAETLGIPRGTVKSRLHRTLGKLRDIINKEFPDLPDVTNA